MPTMISSNWAILVASGMWLSQFVYLLNEALLKKGAREVRSLQ